ncbi:N-acetylglucosaminyltransferase [Nowakowskiella sp. JEL0078]|nr:N-acetylglucosaminyltransferase [Nowakowskiella sp. JEL0078]
MDFVGKLPEDIQFKILSLLNNSISHATQNPALGADTPISVARLPCDLLRKFNPANVTQLLSQYGYAIIDDFIPYFKCSSGDITLPDLIETCQTSITSLKPAGVGTGITKKYAPSIRGDLTRLFSNSDLISEKDETTKAMNKLRARILSLVEPLNDLLMTSTSRLTPRGLQLAYFPGKGAQYTAHRDCSPLNPERRLTMLFYVNPSWKPGDGGELRLHPAGSHAVDIEPLANRLLIFRCDLLHQVLPTFADRFAVTMWLYASEGLNLPSIAKTIPRSLTSRPTIFVSIPSYCDSETHATVKSLVSSASYPSRLRIGILYQDNLDEHEDLHSNVPLPIPFQSDFSKGSSSPGSLLQIRGNVVPTCDAFGPAYARAEIFENFFDNEDYYLQIDSHMRFAEGWDDFLIECVTKGQDHTSVMKKWVITFYPPPYTMPDDHRIPPFGPVIMHPMKFDSDGMLKITGRVLKNEKNATSMTSENPQLIQQKFVAAGFLFTSSETMKKCPLDMNLKGLFFGEEIALSARLWTSGFDFAVPISGPKGSNGLVWHLWSRKHRRTWWEDLNSESRKTTNEMRQLSQIRIMKMLSKKENTIEKFGLGIERTLEQFEEFCGVNFDEKKIKTEFDVNFE